MMAMAEFDDDLEIDNVDDEQPAGNTIRTVEAVVDKINDGAWVPPETALDLGPNLRWRCDLIRHEKLAVLHVHLAEVLRSYIVQRLRAARHSGYEVHFAMPLESLYLAEVQFVLADLDAHVHLIDRDNVLTGSHHLDALVDAQVAVSPTARTAIAKAAWARRDEGTNQQKGKFFESLLAFLLEQVPDFRIIERNYRGDSDEVDVWVQIANFSARIWQENGVPFLLVEAKNRADKASAPFVVHIKAQLREKRRRTRIGILCSTSPFTSDAVLEVVKLAESEFSVALLGPDQMEAWIKAADGTAFLEAQVRKAMVR